MSRSDDARPTAGEGSTATGASAAVLQALAAALLAGFGGLAFELAALRRTGLLLGNTAEASSAVVGVFLLGLGIGGFLASRRALRGRAGGAVGLAYGAVALAVRAGVTGLGAIDPPGPVVGSLVLAVCVLAPAAVMGFAFPLLFAFAPRVAPGWIVAANLAGSVGAAFFAGNFLLPGLGIDATAWIAAGCYALAALAVLRAPEANVEVPSTSAGAAPSAVGRRAASLAVASGLLTVGFEVLLFRRLPFFLEGFQPTVSGVLAACLLALTAGSAASVLIRAPAAGAVWAHRALVLGALLACIGVHERAGPALARLAVSSDLGLHGRVLGGALLAAVPLIPLGAVVPALLADVRPAERRKAAGLLFLWQGVGSLLGSLLVGQLLPVLASTSFFVWAGPGAALAALCVAVGAGRPSATGIVAGAGVLASVVLGFGGAGTPWEPSPPVRGSRYDRPEAYVPLAHRTDPITTASVVYDRANHSRVLFTDEFRAAYTGPGTSYMQVLGHLPFLLRRDLDEVAVLALGTGTTAEAVRVWPQPTRIHVVEISRAVFSLCDRFAADGLAAEARPAPFRVDPRTEVHLTDGRRWLATQARESLDLLTMEPLLPYAPGTAPLYSAEFYRAVRACLRPGGLCVQWVPTHAMPRPMFETLLGTFADAFDHTSIWLVDQSTLLVGSRDLPHLPTPEVLAGRFRDAPPEALGTLHEAGIANVDDLAAACLVPRASALFPDAERLVDDRPFLEQIGYWSGAVRLSFYPDNLGALGELVAASAAGEHPLGGTREVRALRLDGLAARARVLLAPDQAALSVARAAQARSGLPGSTLLHAEETLALRALVLDRARTDSPDVVRAAARRQVERDPGSAEVQILAGADERAVARALAIDPTVGLRAPWAFALAGVEPPAEIVPGPLEVLPALPEGPALVAAAAVDDPLGAALRAAYRVRVGRALVAELGQRPLDRSGEAFALAQVLDPALWEEATSAVLGARGGLAALEELSPVWRRDLPVPAAFALLATADDPALRLRFVEGLEGRRGPRVAEVLADLALDDARTVRVAASAAAFRAFGAAAAFDPDASESERQRAADRLRALHNRRP